MVTIDGVDAIDNTINGVRTVPRVESVFSYTRPITAGSPTIPN
jgi:hypothetical protein